MLINEKGLVRNIKRAFKGEGYTVQNLGDRICVYGGDWYVQGMRALFPRKACSGWAKEWERVCWGALESVNLHKEENA